MDADRLDRLSRSLASGPTRRRVLGGVGLLLASRALVPSAPAQAQEAEGEDGWVVNAEGLGICRLPGFPCGNNGQCCAGGCSAEGTCGCRNRGRRAWRAAICCSGKKKRGNKGKCR